MSNDLNYKMKKMILNNLNKLSKQEQLNRILEGMFDVDVWDEGKYKPINEKLGVFDLRYEEVKREKELYDNRIRNILLTRKGEIPNDPEFGSELYDYVFFNERNFSEEQIRLIIRDQLRKYIPEIDIPSDEDITIEKKTDEETGDIYVVITIGYVIPYVGKRYLNLKITKN